MDTKGKMQKPNEDWEERFQDLISGEPFVASVFLNTEAYEKLTPQEYLRLQPKLELVMRAAKGQAIGMLKGTIKYPSDNHTVESWLAHIVDEGYDQSNYNALLLDAYEREQAGG